ncbi:MAG TPA: flagellar biosynthesis anti-sigma factor FlgM, partial [Clostridium sp.]|nr:flagellar biosynthesis anti-sigma factor FlgM [Clostridium sp.]
KVINLYKTNKKIEVKETRKDQGDSIEISSLGKSLSHMNLDENFQVSEKQIEQIRNEISNGTYNIDSKLVAEKMISFMKGREI